MVGPIYMKFGRWEIMSLMGGLDKKKVKWASHMIGFCLLIIKLLLISF